jgi:hypothetical protein
LQNPTPPLARFTLALARERLGEGRAITPMARMPWYSGLTWPERQKSENRHV